MDLSLKGDLLMPGSPSPVQRVETYQEQGPCSDLAVRVQTLGEQISQMGIETDISSAHDKSKLPEKVVSLVAARLMNQDWDVKVAAFQVLQDQSELSVEMWNMLIMWLKEQEQAVRRAAIKTLQGRSNLSEGILKMVAAS